MSCAAVVAMNGASIALDALQCGKASVMFAAKKKLSLKAETLAI